MLKRKLGTLGRLIFFKAFLKNFRLTRITQPPPQFPVLPSEPSQTTSPMTRSTSFIKMLILSNILLLSTVAYLVLTGFSNPSKPYFEEINVERLNIIGASGKPVLVLSNKKNMPGPSMNGKTYPREVIDGREYFSGMLFFNELGDEVGGLIYAGIKKDSMGGYSAVSHLSFDQWKQNQVLALDYNDNGKNRYKGLRIWDRPANVSFDKKLDLMQAIREAKNNPVRRDSLMNLWRQSAQRGENGIERMFIGSRNEIPQIQLKDKQGKIRIRLMVNEKDEAKLEFLNEKGEVTAVFPE